MSLRRDIREAIDEVAPPAPQLPAKVVTFVFPARRDQRVTFRRRARGNNWFRGPLILVAGALVVALVAGVLMGGRLWSDWQKWSVAHPNSINQVELSRLESRPLQPLPPIPSTGVCPAGPLTTSPVGSMWYGNGAVHLTDFGAYVFTTDWGKWSETPLELDPGSSGLFLIRARDVASGQPLPMWVDPTLRPTIHLIPAGEYIARDVVNGQEIRGFSEIVVDASAPGGDKMFGSAHVRQVDFYVGYPKGGSGCLDFQIDHGKSTEVIVAPL